MGLLYKSVAAQNKGDDNENKEDDIRNNKKNVLSEYGKTNQLARQLVDLALLANNMLKGEELNKFIRRSVEIIKWFEFLHIGVLRWRKYFF